MNVCLPRVLLESDVSCYRQHFFNARGMTVILAQGPETFNGPEEMTAPDWDLIQPSQHCFKSCRNKRDRKTSRKHEKFQLVIVPISEQTDD